MLCEGTKEIKFYLFVLLSCQFTVSMQNQYINRRSSLPSFIPSIHLVACLAAFDSTFISFVVKSRDIFCNWFLQGTFNKLLFGCIPSSIFSCLENSQISQICAKKEIVMVEVELKDFSAMFTKIYKKAMCKVPLFLHDTLIPPLRMLVYSGNTKLMEICFLRFSCSVLELFYCWREFCAHVNNIELNLLKREKWVVEDVVVVLECSVVFYRFKIQIYICSKNFIPSNFLFYIKINHRPFESLIA